MQATIGCHMKDRVEGPASRLDELGSHMIAGTGFDPPHVSADRRQRTRPYLKKHSAMRNKRIDPVLNFRHIEEQSIDWRCLFIFASSCNAGFDPACTPPFGAGHAPRRWAERKRIGLLTEPVLLHARCSFRRRSTCARPAFLPIPFHSNRFPGCGQPCSSLPHTLMLRGAAPHRRAAHDSPPRCWARSRCSASPPHCPPCPRRRASPTRAPPRCRSASCWIHRFPLRSVSSRTSSRSSPEIASRNPASSRR
jgi:hypothetical protein